MEFLSRARAAGDAWRARRLTHSLRAASKIGVIIGALAILAGVTLLAVESNIFTSWAWSTANSGYPLISVILLLVVGVALVIWV